MERQVPKLTGWVEENIEETLTYFRLPLAHRKHMKSTNMLERLNEEDGPAANNCRTSARGAGGRLYPSPPSTWKHWRVIR
jgi:transposase-like protein